MNKWMKSVVGSAMVLGAPVLHAADGLDMLPFALSGSTPALDMRARYEFVDQNDPTNKKKAHARTLRTRLGATTGKWNGFDLSAEFENIVALGGDPYFSGARPLGNGKVGRDGVLDPEGTEINQYWIRYVGLMGTTATLGRQRLILDNARFIGNVGWRQNEMTYDAFSVINNGLLPKTTLTYAYVGNANFVSFADFKMTSHLANARFAYSPVFNLTGYAYLLDFEVDLAARRDTQTLGLRAFGAVPFAQDFSFLYTAEIADQSDYQDSPATVDAQYGLLEVGAGYKALANAKIGYETLGSNGGLYGFQTPLGTNHAFQGWADLFLATPNEGVNDLYLSVGGTVLKANLAAMYHDYKSDSGSTHYGREINLQAVYPLNFYTNLTVKYADYQADEVNAGFPAARNIDTQKFWVMAEYKF